MKHKPKKQLVYRATAEIFEVLGANGWIKGCAIIKPYKDAKGAQCYFMLVPCDDKGGFKEVYTPAYKVRKSK